MKGRHDPKGDDGGSILSGSLSLASLAAKSQGREKVRRPMMMVAVLAFGLALPAFAQQTNAVDQQTRQQVEAIVMKYTDALNSGDGQAMANLYGPNPISITPTGKNTTTAGIQENVEMVHKRGLTISAKIDGVQPILGGQGVVATAPYTGVFTKDPGSPHVQGNFLFVLEHAGGDWKLRAFTASRLVPAVSAK